MNEKTTSLTDDQMNERSLGSIKKHQRGLKALTGAALVFWLVAMLGSVFILWAYAFMYLPKEKQMSDHFRNVFQTMDTNVTSTNEWNKARAEDAQIAFVMGRAVGIGMVLTAACVAVLSAGMLATIILVIWNRRVTLRQINANLTQISAQLKELERRER